MISVALARARAAAAKESALKETRRLKNQEGTRKEQERGEDCPYLDEKGGDDFYDDCACEAELDEALMRRTTIIFRRAFFQLHDLRWCCFLTQKLR